MPVVPFGFSVGDFVTVITLIWQVCETLNKVSSCYEEFQETKLELKSLGDIIERLQKSISEGITISTEDANKVRDVLDCCQKSLKEFEQLVAEYANLWSSRNKSNPLKNTRKRISFVLFGKNKIDLFRKRVQNHLQVLTLLQQDLSW